MRIKGGLQPAVVLQFAVALPQTEVAARLILCILRKPAAQNGERGVGEVTSIRVRAVPHGARHVQAIGRSHKCVPLHQRVWPPSRGSSPPPTRLPVHRPCSSQDGRCVHMPDSLVAASSPRHQNLRLAAERSSRPARHHRRRVASQHSWSHDSPKSLIALRRPWSRRSRTGSSARD